MLRLFGWTLTQIGVFAGHPAAFVVTAVFVAAWLVLDFKSFGWHATATVVTWFMTLFIQRADNRIRTPGRTSLTWTNGSRRRLRSIVRRHASSLAAY
jgi:low affinity Fe/Cu permease